MTVPVDLFDLTTYILKKAGYKVKMGNDKYRSAFFKGNNIEGGYCEHNGESYATLDGRVAADHTECFNKWSQCPLVVELPTNLEEGKLLIGYLEWLGTPKAKTWSSQFGYLDNPYLPNMQDTNWKPIPNPL